MKGRTIPAADKHDGIDGEPAWSAVLERNERCDGQFVYAVGSTGVYCRPSCPSRRPNRKNVTFFLTPDDAERAGYRACRRCLPRSVAPSPAAEAVQRACTYIESHLDESVTLAALGREVGVSPSHLQRTFKKIVGVSPKEFARTALNFSSFS